MISNKYIDNKYYSEIKKISTYLRQELLCGMAWRLVYNSTKGFTPPCRKKLLMVKGGGQGGGGLVSLVNPALP